MNKVSIIIPNYNNYSVLKNCINSINKSTIKNYEIIIVDDCSTDINIKKYYSEISKKIHIIFNKTNKGPSYSRNRGAASAKGNILLFLDSDCYIFPDTLQKIDDFFKFNKELSCLGGTYTIKSASKSFFSDFQCLTQNYFETKKKYPSFLGSCCFAIKKDLFKKTEGFFIGKYIGRRPNVEDVFFGFKLNQMGEKLFKSKDILIQHDSNYTFLKSIKNAFKKSFTWVKLSFYLNDIIGDSGAASKELKLSVIILFSFLLTLITGFFYTKVLLLSLLLLILNLINLHPLIKISSKNLGFIFTIFFYLYFTFIYSFFVGLGSIIGTIDYFLFNKKEL